MIDYLTIFCLTAQLEFQLIKAADDNSFTVQPTQGKDYHKLNAYFLPVKDVDLSKQER